MKLTSSQEFAKKFNWKNKYIVITGDRQVGKTTLLLEIAKDWLAGNNTLNIEHLIIVLHNQLIVNEFQLELENKSNNIQIVPSIYNANIYANKNMGIFIDDADHKKNSSKILDFIRHKHVKKLVMTGELLEKYNTKFFSDIIATCQSEWCDPLFKHYDLFASNFDDDNNDELELLYKQRLEIDQKIKNILINK